MSTYSLVHTALQVINFAVVLVTNVSQKYTFEDLNYPAHLCIT